MPKQPANEEFFPEDIVMSESSPGSKTRRKSETPAQRIERLERELQAAKHEAKKAEQRRCAIVGAALLAEAEGNPSLRTQFVEILRRRVTSPAAKAEIATLLILR